MVNGCRGHERRLLTHSDAIGRGEVCERVVFVQGALGKPTGDTDGGIVRVLGQARGRQELVDVVYRRDDGGKVGGPAREEEGGVLEDLEMGEGRRSE